jgi:hypothetical protein
MCLSVFQIKTKQHLTGNSHSYLRARKIQEIFPTFFCSDIFEYGELFILNRKTVREYFTITSKSFLVWQEVSTFALNFKPKLMINNS